MTNLSLLSATERAAPLESAIKWLGRFDQPGIDALVDRLATATACDEVDAGLDLIARWTGGPDT